MAYCVLPAAVATSTGTHDINELLEAHDGSIALGLRRCLSALSGQIGPANLTCLTTPVGGTLTLGACDVTKDTRPMFCFTLDTEPDNLWEVQDTLKFSHFEFLADFHSELTRRGARPTYLTTSEVAEDPGSRAVMLRILETGSAEVGAHFHTWTRPWPFTVPALGAPPLQAMAHQLGPEVEERMLSFTCESLSRHLGTRPVSYRGGRWSLGRNSIGALQNCGIKIDTTVTPGRSWTDPTHRLVDGPDYREFPRRPFFLQPGSLEPRSSGPVLELPVGAAHRPATGVRSVINAMRRRLRTPPAAPRSKLDWVWLRPTSMSLPQLSGCLRGLAADTIPVWVAMIHSSEIIPCVPLKTDEAVRAFKERCFRLVEEAQELGARCATLREAGEAYGNAGA